MLHLKIHVDPRYDCQLEDVLNAHAIYPAWRKSGSMLVININVPDTLAASLTAALTKFQLDFPAAALSYELTVND